MKRDLYFKVSSRLWTSGEFQQLSASGLAMLLILFGGRWAQAQREPFPQGNAFRPQGREVWFTTENFPARFGISAAMRSRGTKELENAFLLHTFRRPVGSPGTLVSFTTEELRKVYVLPGDADGGLSTRKGKGQEIPGGNQRRRSAAGTFPAPQAPEERRG